MAQIVLNNLSELNAILEKQVMDILKKIGEEIKGVLRNILKKEWYNRPGFDESNSQYERTMMLLDSITLSPVKKIANEYSCKIYYDTDKILPLDGTFNKPWTRHKSITTGTIISPYLPLWIEEGQDSPIYAYEGVHPVEKTIEWEKDDKYLLNRFRELLEARGIRVIVS